MTVVNQINPLVFLSFSFLNPESKLNNTETEKPKSNITDPENGKRGSQGQNYYLLDQ